MIQVGQFANNCGASQPLELEIPMQDLTMLLFTIVFFVLAFLYVKACQKLR
jgi:hypothetical protein